MDLLVDTVSYKYSTLYPVPEQAPPRVSVAFGRQRPGGNGQASKASGCRVPASRTSDLPNRVLAYAPDPNEDADDARTRPRWVTG